MGWVRYISEINRDPEEEVGDDEGFEDEGNKARGPEGEDDGLEVVGDQHKGLEELDKVPEGLGEDGGGLCDPLDVVAENLAGHLGSTLAQSHADVFKDVVHNAGDLEGDGGGAEEHKNVGHDGGLDSLKAVEVTWRVKERTVESLRDSKRTEKALRRR